MQITACDNCGKPCNGAVFQTSKDFAPVCAVRTVTLAEIEQEYEFSLTLKPSVGGVDLCPPCLKSIVEQMASEIVPQMRNGNHASEEKP